MESVLKKYKVLYADPPWHFSVWSEKGNTRSAAHHYSTQQWQYLADMPVAGLTEENAVLLMWATFPCLKQAMKLGVAWGFVYKTVAFTWVKTNRRNHQPSMGMGYYTRANAEVVLLFTKGKPLKRIAKNVRQVLLAPKGRHSEKPAEIRNRIVQLFGNVSRLELFARSKPGVDHEELFNGWDVFGNEVLHSIALPSNQQLK